MEVLKCFETKPKTSSNLPKRQRTAGFWNVYFLGKYISWLNLPNDLFYILNIPGISLVFADLLISWTDGFERSFWEYVICTVIVGLGYVCLMLCVAEMTSILPFGGKKKPFVFSMNQSFIYSLFRRCLWLRSCHNRFIISHINSQ